ncbi:hypothetical protein AB0K11_14065 [Mycobacterium sp. NPDC050551]|uniref:hypothetical protein n=1 Tax=Mycobacterium sp. NPDC050551 TaxID=3155407 RepID=UPI00341C924D
MAPAPSRFEYAVWFRNLRRAHDDQDYEWPAVFAIEADTAEAAQAWGDHLARSFAARSDEIFLGSKIKPLSDEKKLLERICDRPVVPLVVCGEEVADDEIGW